MNIIEIIQNRKSRRTFTSLALNPSDRREIETYINENKKYLPGNEIVNFNIVRKRTDTKEMRLEYGIIRGHHTYILGKSKSNLASRINYGYMMEKVVLKATEMNLATCWVGYFDQDYFNETTIEKGYEIPSIVIIGYSKEEHSFPDKVARLVVSASKRKTWDKLFFDFKSRVPLTPGINNYSDSLEMVRWAPSSGNTQPWRVFFDNTHNEYHFFKKSINRWYEVRGLHDIDMGIALSHFELTSRHNGLAGSWVTKETIDTIDDLQYIITWRCA
jgi:nitroreductase